MIATVLIVVITLVIAALFTGLSRKYINDGKQEITLSKTDLRCGTDVGISVAVVADRYKMCVGNETDPSINFTLINTGQMAIDDLQVKVYLTDGLSDNKSLLTEKLLQGKTIELGMIYDDSLGQIRQVNIVPRIKKTGQTEPIFCEESQLTFSDIALCG
jgi:uncharacterized protein YpmB